MPSSASLRSARGGRRGGKDAEGKNERTKDADLVHRLAAPLEKPPFELGCQSIEAIRIGRRELELVFIAGSNNVVTYKERATTSSPCTRCVLGDPLPH